MTIDTNNPPHGETQIFFHIKWVGKVSLMVGAAAFMTLLLVLAYITDKSGTSYWEVVKSRSMTRQSLGPAMLVAGLSLVAVTALMTWLISLYASFRVAGPLYRFSRNLELLIENGAATLVPIRRQDQLQQEGEQLQLSVKRLQIHDAAIGAVAGNVQSLLEEGGVPQGSVKKAIAKLQELDSHVQL
jgi:hypothetical protein